MKSKCLMHHFWPIKACCSCVIKIPRNKTNNIREQGVSEELEVKFPFFRKLCSICHSCIKFREIVLSPLQIKCLKIRSCYMLSFSLNAAPFHYWNGIIFLQSSVVGSTNLRACDRVKVIKIREESGVLMYNNLWNFFQNCILSTKKGLWSRAG